jgi:hypothetical protein
MWWECSECGSTVERPRRPVACRECGTAGVIFVPADEPGETASVDDLRSAWLRAGLERGHLARV